MIVDSSALIAIIFGEPEGGVLLEQLMSGSPRMSAATYFESGMVIDRKAKDDFAAKAFDRLLNLARVEVVAVTREHADIARVAYREFGKGNHPASLNFGDCLAYALARQTGEPLLFKGDDFARTDVVPALK
ncbi:type II toxin-antitoxin system VapC family toxin [Brevundimonas sp. GCM10030266]|uniref:type II toxin-antitoxin system VapC family toxin n=1 Tax=Brevundimonas sp. GCM10030266 TaxID=3273386 RepID=UPI00361D837C